MNLKLRLNLIITLLLLVIIAMGAISTIHNARQNVQAEIASTAVLAVHMLDAEILLYSYGAAWGRPSDGAKRSNFNLKKLQNVRHLKIEFFNVFGDLIDSNHYAQHETIAPDWFVRAMDSVTEQMQPTRRQVFNAGQMIGELVVTPDPLNEIDEVWEETKTMLVLLIFFIITANVLIYLAVNQALKPIDRIIDALSEIESGKFSLRLPQFSLPELTNISNKFNVMADTLQKSVEMNRRLHQQIINVQEHERKSLARELHDEIGQHLTAINVDAAAIKTAPNLKVAQESGSAISDVVRQMIDIVRNILQRLRPADLDELGLKLALAELVNTWQLRNSMTVCQLNVQGEFVDLDDSPLIAIYRIVQECLTNVARHSNAQHVDITLIQEIDEISFTVKDDGVGFDLSQSGNGFGLLGMKERCEGLNGSFHITTEINEGVCIEVRLPC
ncbi:MAG: HAMP domain-containing protein [Gammaproteobacteria bacterium]|nr:HAMP domain-containing protein [Gammaproteobacteria bacterium]